MIDGLEKNENLKGSPQTGRPSENSSSDREGQGRSRARGRSRRKGTAEPSGMAEEESLFPGSPRIRETEEAFTGAESRQPLRRELLRQFL